MLLLFACQEPAEPITASALSSELHGDVGTIAYVSWHQSAPSSSWVEYEVDGETRATPAVDRDGGTHEQVLLGLPGDTEISWRVVIHEEHSELDKWQSEAQTLTTDAVPADFPTIDVPVWEPDQAHGADFVFGSVDINGGDPYTGPFWLYIADREGRVVWWRDLDWDMSMFPRVARDGTHLAWDQRTFFDTIGDSSRVMRTTLDGAWSIETPAAGMGWTWDETEHGSIVFDRTIGTSDLQLVERDDAGDETVIWDCTAWLASTFDGVDPEACYTNTTNYSADRDTVLWSTYWGDYVAEIDRSTGAVLWYAGALDGGLAFDPPEAAFDLQHYPNWTPDGTLLVSTHIAGVDGEQRAREFEVDTDAGVLTEIWSYGEGVTEVWAKYSGDAVRLDNGNTVQNYGTGGELREVTPDGEIVWSFQFGDSFTVGHADLITDLYALNEGR